MNDTFSGIVLALRKSNKTPRKLSTIITFILETLFLPMDYLTKEYKKGSPFEEINQLSVPCLLVDTRISDARLRYITIETFRLFP